MIRNKPIVQSVDRAIQILSLFKRSSKLRLTDIAKEMGLAKSTVYGLVSTLEQSNFLQQDIYTGTYSLGIGLFELGSLFAERLDLRREALPYLHSLVERFSETAQLGILQGREVVYLDVAEGPSSLKFAAGIGGRTFANCSAIGKLLLSDLEEEALDKLFGERDLPTRTPRSVSSFVSLKEHLKIVKSQGYSIDDEEFEIGVRAVAVGIRNHTGKLVAAISLGGPATRVTYDVLSDHVSALIEVTDCISSRIGY